LLLLREFLEMQVSSLVDESLSLAAAISCMLCRCLMAAASLRQAVSMPHGRNLLGACCDVAYCRSQCGASCLLLKAGSEPKDIVNERSHVFKCSSLGLPAKVGVQAEKRKILGYYTSSAGEAVPRCARDEIADPLHSLDGVERMIRDGAFLPHADRLGHTQYR
jgi:hypothetical protein